MALQEIIDFLIKLTLAALFGGMIGLERKLSNKAAGVRTMILICLGTTLFVEVAISITQNSEFINPGDITRMIGHIISGIGFLGAGAILRVNGDANNKNYVEGLTTAAAIWCVSAIGILIGIGLYTQAGITTLFAVFTLTFFKRAEDKIVNKINSLKNSKK
jgi:putative Mg2+ transporter-C (MgtC) family protein